MTTENKTGATEVVMPESETTDTDSPPRKLRAANLFCGVGLLATAARSAGMDVVYVHDINASYRDSYAKRFGVRPAEGMGIYFPDVPKFDVLLATTTKRNLRTETRLIMKFLRGRRPETFIIVGPQAADERDQTRLFKLETQDLHYGVKGATKILKDIYQPLLGERPVTVGTYHLDPAAIPVLSSGELTEGDELTVVNAMLRQVAGMYR